MKHILFNITNQIQPLMQKVVLSKQMIHVEV
jgi:hypothetical protein